MNLLKLFEVLGTYILVVNLVSKSASPVLLTVVDSNAAVYSLIRYGCRVYVDVYTVEPGVVDLVLSVFVVVVV